MFSAALGLIGGIGSLVMGGYQYSLGMQELALKREALQEQKNFGLLQYGMALDQARKEDEQVKYLREMNERNMLAQSLERAKMERQRETRLAAFQDERDYVLNRQLEIDRAAAEQYALELEAYLGNKDIAASERDLALSYLEEARATARGERDDDIRRLREEKLIAAQERDFAISELRNSQSIAARERIEDISYRDQIMGQLSDMSTALQSAYDEYGAISLPRGMSEGDILSTIDRYEANAVSSVDRAADRVASIAEAGLVDRGMSRGSTANSVRAGVAANLANEYETARLNARNQAMDYIRSRDAMIDSDFQRQVSARDASYRQIQSLYDPIISAMAQNRGTLSANAYQSPVGIGSSNVIRNVGSANDYGTPLAVGSAMMTPTGMSGRVGQTLNTPSIADAYVTTGDYNQFQPQMWQLTSPSGYMSNASSLLGSIAGQYDPNSFIERGMKLYGSGFAAIGGSLNDMSKSNWFNKGS